MASVCEIGLLNILEAIEEAEDLNSFQRQFNSRKNPFEIPEKDFIKIFRLNKRMAEDIVDKIDPYMHHSSISWGLETADKLFASLRFFAAGAYQMDVACNKFCAMSQPSVSRSINEVVNAFEQSGLLNDWVHFPQSFQELNEKRSKYKFHMYGNVN